MRLSTDAAKLHEKGMLVLVVLHARAVWWSLDLESLVWSEERLGWLAVDLGREGSIVLPPDVDLVAAMVLLEIQYLQVGERARQQ